METIIIAIVLFLLVFFLKHGLYAVKMTKKETGAEKLIINKLLKSVGSDNLERISDKRILESLEITETNYFNLFIKKLDKIDIFTGAAVERYEKYLFPEIESILKDIGTFEKTEIIKGKQYEKWIFKTSGTYYVIIAVSKNMNYPFMVFGTIDK